MKKKNPLSVFRGKQGHMYAALILLWKNYLQRQTDFANENSKYTED